MFSCFDPLVEEESTYGGKCSTKAVASEAKLKLTWCEALFGSIDLNDIFDLAPRTLEHFVEAPVDEASFGKALKEMGGVSSEISKICEK